MTFLPKGYTTPEIPSKYMKFEDGENLFRVLSPAITGWEHWMEDKEGNRTPNRVVAFKQLPEEIQTASDPRKKAKHFWAFVVFNYSLKEVQILEVTQRSIMRGIEGLVNSKSWGDPKEYDIAVIRTKTGKRDMDVEYSVMPQPKTEIDEGVRKVYEMLNIRLDALYEGEDPFSDLSEEEEDELAEKADKEIEE